MPILLLILVLFLSCCTHLAPSPAVYVALYENVAESFLMVTREDVAEKDKMNWRQASGYAIEEDGWHYLYTARHIIFDKTNNGALPKKLYATTLQGESHTIDLSKLEVPDGNHDVVRIELQQPVCRELHLANLKPRYDETLSVFGATRGAGVMCADAGKVMAIGPLEFEHDVDTIKGMSRGLWWPCGGLRRRSCRPLREWSNDDRT